MSTSGNIVFVGVDVCARANVLASVGYRLLYCECEVDALRGVLAQGQADAILFQCIPEPPSRVLLATARALSAAPLILFASESSDYVAQDFDVVLDGLCSPGKWLPPISEAIECHRNLERRKPPQAESIDTSRTRERSSAK